MLEQYRNLATALGHILQKKSLYREPPNGGFLLYELLILPLLGLIFRLSWNSCAGISQPHVFPWHAAHQFTSELALRGVPANAVNNNA
jgi:hypothetical protein